MREFVIAVMLAVLAIPGPLKAQRGGRGGGAIARPGFGGGSGAGRFGGAMDRGWNRRPGLTGSGFGSYGWSDSGFYGDPFYQDWAGTNGDGYQPAPPVYLVMPFQTPPEPAPAPPPEPARPVIHEYSWPNDGADHPAAYSIVSRDSSVHRAVAVWVQDNEVRFTGAGGTTGRIAPAAIDCKATARLNADNKLRLWLPGCVALP
jgi:hypothetical protein